jgi:hypothetical protein
MSLVLHSSVLSRLLILVVSSFSEKFRFLFAKNKAGEYSRLGRIIRIIRFLRRSARRRKRNKKQQKRNKRDKKKKERRFKRRMLRRKLKVIFRALILGKKSAFREKQKQEKRKQKAWKKRRKKRIRKVILKSFFKKAPKSRIRLQAREQKKKELAFMRYRRKRIFRFIIRRKIRIWADFIKGKGFPKKKKKGPSFLRQLFGREYMIIALNSLFFFLMAYFIVAFIEKLGMAFTAMHFDYKSVIYYYKVEYLVDYDAWYADSVKAIFASGPILCTIIATLWVILYSKIYLEDGLLKLLLLWGIFHGFNSLLGGALIGALSGKEFGYAIMYMYYSDTGKLVIALVMLLLMVVLGSSSVKFWIFSANSYFNFSKPGKRQLFIVSQVFIPYLLGNALIILINNPKQTAYHIMVNLSLIFMLIPVLLLSRYHQEYYFDEKNKKIKLSVSSLLAVVILIAIYRIGLEYGLRFG